MVRCVQLSSNRTEDVPHREFWSSCAALLDCVLYVVIVNVADPLAIALHYARATHP